MNSSKKICPCHSDKEYESCCAPYHIGSSHPENAYVLMRSRYSAYALGLWQYIIHTTHPDHPSSYTETRSQWKRDILLFSRSYVFQGLTILEHIEGEEESFVSFIAHLLSNGKDASFCEKSRFMNVNGKWLYRDGVILESPQSIC